MFMGTWRHMFLQRWAQHQDTSHRGTAQALLTQEEIAPPPPPPRCQKEAMEPSALSLLQNKWLHWESYGKWKVSLETLLGLSGKNLHCHSFCMGSAEIPSSRQLGFLVGMTVPGAMCDLQILSRLKRQPTCPTLPQVKMPKMILVCFFSRAWSE